MHESVLKVLLFFSLPLVAADCAPKSYSDLQKEFKGQQKKLVFFASWCAECADSLKAPQENTVYISVFDEKNRADAVAEKFGLKRCILDTDIAKKLKVTSVPASKEVKF